MLTFAYPWLAALLPLPLLVLWLLPAHAESRRGVRVPFFGAAGVAQRPAAARRRRRRPPRPLAQRDA